MSFLNSNCVPSLHMTNERQSAAICLVKCGLGQHKHILKAKSNLTLFSTEHIYTFSDFKQMISCY